MARLVLGLDGLVLREIPLIKERTTIGRRPGNDIQIDNLVVSGEHAVVVTIMADSFLEDLGSTNGTLVNGNAVRKHFLRNNDVIELGKYRLRYVSDEAEGVEMPIGIEKTRVIGHADRAEATGGLALAELAAVVAETPLISGATAAYGGGATPPAGLVDTGRNLVTPVVPPRSSTQPPAGPLAAVAVTGLSMPSLSTAAPASSTAVGPVPVAPGIGPTPAQPDARRAAALQVLSGVHAGRGIELVKPLTTVGRPGEQVAVITRRANGYFLTHVEGDQPPAVNGSELAGSAQQLLDHDVIELAGVKLEFFYKD